MMNYIRSIVSGKKKRYKDRKYDLDLSYICPRLIAMAFPGSGIQTVYRNNISSVLEYDWVDHHAPPLKMLFEICCEIDKYLKENEENIVVVNCRAGKGRTGTIICCYLLFSGRFISADDAFDYYSKKRFDVGEGVTQPSQRRYVYYFARLLKERIHFPLVRSIVSITVKKPPQKLLNGTLKPYFEIYLDNSDELSYSNKCGYFDQKKIFANTADKITITDSDFILPVCGDLTIKIYNNKLISTKQIGRIAFNTAFINEETNSLVFNVREIDPDNLAKTPGIPPEFEFIVKFAKHCECSNQDPEMNICDKCREFLKDQINDWKFINKIVDENSNLEDSNDISKVLLFGKFGDDDVELILQEANEDGKIFKFIIIDSDSEKKEDMNTSFDNECLIF